MITIPDLFHFRLTDDRLRELIFEVWERLPEYDQDVLSQLVAEVYDDRAQEEHVFGEAGWDYPDVPSGQGIIMVDDSDSCPINLTNAKGIESDAACMAVIAHEFAHVVLRH